MVKLGERLFNIFKGKSQIIRKHTFIDKLRIYVRGGSGGGGLPKFGGIGGKGGNVYLVAKENLTLKDVYLRCLSKRYIAKKGDESRRFCLKGQPGKDIFVNVPVGIIVNSQDNVTICELNEKDSRVIVASGAEGGNPDSGYNGLRTSGKSILLDLKLIADVGLVGFPNAGKSTLLAALSRANPRIANFPFTTIQPQLGIMEYEDLRQISVADLPGLIEGAHMNVGLGHQFLKHVERTKLHLFIVDIHGFKLGVKYPSRSAFETIVLLNKELELYKPELVSKPSILLVNKMDKEGSDTLLEELQEKLKHQESAMKDMRPEHRPENLVRFEKIIPISARQLESTDEVRSSVRNVLDMRADEKYTLDVLPELNKQKEKIKSLDEHFDKSWV